MSTRRLLDRPPRAEIAKRAAEAGAGLAAAAHAVGLKNYAAGQRAHNKRVEDSHRFGMATAGMKTEDMNPALPEDQMGDIIVTGDLYGDEAVKVLRSGSPAAPQDSSAKSESDPPAAQPVVEAVKIGMSTRAKVVVALGAVALGSSLVPAVGLSLAKWMGAFDKPPAASEFVDTDTFPGVVIERPGAKEPLPTP